MDFDDSPEEASFRAEARDWLATHARPRSTESSEVRRFHNADPSPQADADHVHRCKEWQRTLYEGGWAGITWPKEYGGRGGSAIEQAIFSEEEARFDVSTGVFAVGIGMAGPTLIAHGTDEQKREHLDPMLQGQRVWCQLFSEPGAGSDLAGLSTRATADGDAWVVTGQKVWTSGAHHSDWAILLARTDGDQPKHLGITYLVMDMCSPGVEVRPLRQINGVAHFNEVFLTEVRVPATNVVGAVNHGWPVAMTTLTSERTLIGGGGAVRFADIAGLARDTGRGGDPVARQGLARAYIRLQLARYLRMRVLTAVSRGKSPGPESSVLKLSYSQHLAAMSDLVLALEGPRGTLVGDDAPDHGLWQQYFLGQWSSRIGGGTDEVQRNVIGERVLGLPPEPRIDKDVPFRQLTGGR
jgi:alkylation response protein AidB-like acyl-CoA dehydrogenase